MRFYQVVLLCMIFLIGCKNQNSEIITIDFSSPRDFRIVNVFNHQKFNDYKNRLPKNIEPNAVTSEPYSWYSYLSLRPQNNFTFLLGNHFMFGTYSLISSTELVLHTNEYGDIPIKIIKEKEGYIQILGDFKKYHSSYMVELDGATNYYLNLATDFEKLNKENDIRSLEFNNWRFKPKFAESENQIKQRLIDNLKYISAYMRVHLYGDFDIIHTEGIPSPFLFAKNGLFLYEWQRVSGFWKYNFYNDKDAEKAYKMLTKVFKKVQPPKFIDNWLAYNEKCIETVIDELEYELTTNNPKP